MIKHPKIPASDDAWDSGPLGKEEKYVRRAEDNVEPKIDEALELQLISIRLQKSLIEDLKLLANLNGIGYQPLIRQVLTLYADSEKKKLLQEAALGNRRYG